MAKHRGKGNDEESSRTELTSDTHGDIDALFGLPLGEFTPARNALAARLKKGGRGDEAEKVKALMKPPVSAWAVNQLYRKHREAFDQLIATGQRFRQASQSAGKADIAESGNARRKSISDLSRLATALLREAGHNPTPDLMRRITTTLEAISAYASLKDAPTPGRLTHDLDPPGFEALAGWVPDSNRTERTEKRAAVIPFQSPGSGQPDENYEARIAAAKAALSNAERALKEARAKAEAVDSEMKRAVAEANEADKKKREAEEQLQQAIAISEEAEQRSRNTAAEAEEAATSVKNAASSVERAADELQSLLQKPPSSRA